MCCVKNEMVRIYFPELEEKISMATEPEETRTFYGWFGCLSPETKEVRLNIVKDIIKELDMSVREDRHVYLCIIEGWRGVPVCMCRSWFDSGHLTNNKS